MLIYLCDDGARSLSVESIILERFKFNWVYIEHWRFGTQLKSVGNSVLNKNYLRLSLNP